MRNDSIEFLDSDKLDEIDWTNRCRVCRQPIKKGKEICDKEECIKNYKPYTSWFYVTDKK